MYGSEIKVFVCANVWPVATLLAGGGSGVTGSVPWSAKDRMAATPTAATRATAAAVSHTDRLLRRRAPTSVGGTRSRVVIVISRR